MKAAVLTGYNKDYQDLKLKYRQFYDLIDGGFASEEQIEKKEPRGSFPRVRILGPNRSMTQVEISKTDARALGVDPPIRLSGDLEGTPQKWRPSFIFKK